MRKIPNLRWWIAGLLAAATALNYLHRQNLPFAVPEIQREIPLTNQQFSQFQVMFLLAYAVMYAGGGRIVDRLGTRAGYAVMIVWWSAANALHGFVSSVFGLGAARFLLGLGEGGGFPASAKAVSEWFPAKERSLAFGIFNTGSSVGALIAPPLIAGIAVSMGWRWVFFLTGAVGFLWAVIWLKFYHAPEDHPNVTPEEYRYIIASRPASPTVRNVRWLSLLRYRQVWGIVAAKFLSDSAWYFFIFWLPKYLADIRHLNITQIGFYAWIPYACAGLGSLSGGSFSSWLVRRSGSIDFSRKVSMAAAAALMPLSLLIAASPLAWCIVFFSTALFGHQFFSTILQTLPADIFPPASVGSVAGLGGASGSLGGMLFNFLVGLFLTSHGYAPVFVVAGVLHPASVLLVLAIVRRIEPVDVSTKAAAV
jgi:ACS family hexuronate transporter-like MFS transporter